MRFMALAAALSSIAGAQARADDSAEFADGIFVTAGRLAGSRAGPTQHTIDAAAIEKSRATSLDALLRDVPAAAVQVNSRGESLVYMRGAGERQTAVFLAGAPINVPWDNRLNLALVPTRAISSVHVTSGPSSVLFGSDAAGGVVELTPAGVVDGPAAAGGFETGQAGLVSGDGLLAGRLGGVELTIGGGHETRDGSPVSDDAILPFSQTEDALRTNTDLRRTTGYAHAAFDLSPRIEAAATVLAVDAAFGVAPEGRVDPATDSPRYWRYPEHRTVIGVLNARYAPASDFETSAALWLQRFDQRIDSFASARYVDLDDAQEDRDRAYGVRLASRRILPSGELRGAFSIVDARHRQTDWTFAAGEAAIDEMATFRRRTFSVGAEYERTFGGLTVMAGGGGDFFQSLDTGGRGPAEGFAGWSATAAVDYRISDQVSVSAAASRKPRPATQRELYGAAVGRFLLNPDLKPEVPIQIEASAAYASDRLRLSVTPFATLTSDTIDQESVLINGVSRRRRINLEGSRAFGVDVVGSAAVTDRLSVSGNVSALHLRSREERTASGDRFIPERPSLLASVAADYADPTGLGLRIEARARGRAYTLDGDAFAPLPRSVEVNLEASYEVRLAGGADVEAYIRADNIADALVEPQLGLPSPGRWIRGGVRFALPGFGA